MRWPMPDALEAWVGRGGGGQCGGGLWRTRVATVSETATVAKMTTVVQVDVAAAELCGSCCHCSFLLLWALLLRLLLLWFLLPQVLLPQVR